MNQEEYLSRFKKPHHGGEESTKEADTRLGRALALALDIRKFEIELYWKRATYFWTFIGASFAGYALTYRTGSTQEAWLSLLFSALGLVFSFTWYLVNRGSKFWQNNWERHVDLLEEETLGPLYKVIAVDQGSRNPLTAPGEFSVSKLNQILSVFITLIWLTLFLRSLWPISPNLPIDPFKAAVFVGTMICLTLLVTLGKSSRRETKFQLNSRKVTVVDQTSKH